MNWHLLLIFAALASTCMCFPPNPLSLEELGSDIGIQVFNQLVKNRLKDNVVVSPHGIASVLGMLQLGADGKTKKQLTTVMRYSVNGVGKVLKKINKAIVSKKNKDVVTIANAVFAKSGLKMEVPFVSRNNEVFQCSVKSIDFEDQDSACDTINQWVKNETKGMIDSVLSPEDIDSVLTRLVLVNAVYFKGLWKSRFQPENTKKRTFNGADGKTYQVPMLAQLSVFRCGTTSTPNDLWYNIIELPYHGESISMLIALPTESTTPLSAIIPHISTKTIQSWMTTMVQKRVQVILPKFTVEAETDLKEPLQELGIRDMFEQSKANFAKITRMSHECVLIYISVHICLLCLTPTGTASLHVSQILQKAKIEVSEDGTKASAATTTESLIILFLSFEAAILIARSSPPWFVVDRPFVFFIRHNPT
ncbi:hypothetical protein JD844_007300, partial [Phrynosoma platyrhinos]